MFSAEHRLNVVKMSMKGTSSILYILLILGRFFLNGLQMGPCGSRVPLCDCHVMYMTQDSQDEEEIVWSHLRGVLNKMLDNIFLSLTHFVMGTIRVNDAKKKLISPCPIAFIPCDVT